MFIHICERRIKYTIHKQAKKNMYTKIETKNEENNQGQKTVTVTLNIVVILVTAVQIFATKKNDVLKDPA